MTTGIEGTYFMQRSQLVFFLIILSAIAIVGGGLLIQALSDNESSDNNNSENGSNTEPIELRIAVNPLVEAWIREAAAEYKRTNPRVKGREVNIQIIAQNSVEVWQGSSSWSVLNHPQVWIPEAAYSLNYAKEVGLNYAPLEASLAQTPIIWGAYQSRADVINSEYGGFNTASIQQAAGEEAWVNIGGDAAWRFIKIGFARPDSTDSGLAALLTLAGSYANDSALTSQTLNDSGLRTWLEPIVDSVPNFSNLGNDPADRMVNTRQSSAEIALLPESQWLLHYEDLTAIEPIVLHYPENYLLLDFPYAVWDGAETTDDQRQAAADFAEFLLSDNQQRKAGEKGLRPAKMTDLVQFSPFDLAQVQLSLPGMPISLPERAGVSNLLRWFEGYRTAP